MAKTREIPLDAKKLKKLIFSGETDIERGFELINILCCLDFSPFGEFEDDNIIDIRCSPSFIEDVKNLKNYDHMSLRSNDYLRITIFYIMRAARGIFFSTKFDYSKIHKKYDFCLQIQDKLYEEKSNNGEPIFVNIGSYLYTEVLPICDDFDHKLTGHKINHYLLFTDIFRKAKVFNKRSENAHDFLSLSKDLNHYILERS